MYLSNSQMLKKSLVLLKDKIAGERKDEIGYGNQCFRKKERNGDQNHEKKQTLGDVQTEENRNKSF